MNLGARIRAAAGTLFGFPRVPDGVVPNYPESALGHPYQLDRLQWDFPKAMRRVAVVRACVLRVANDIAQLPVVFETQQGQDYVPIPRKPGNIVDVWRAANGEQTSFEFVRDLHANLKASGNAYMVMEDFGTGRVQEVWTTPPQCVEVVVGARRHPEAYVFNRGGRRESVPAENVLHFKGYNPDFEPVGASDLETVELSYSTRYDVDRLLQAFVRNGGVPAGYWKATSVSGKPVALTEPQVNALKARLDRLYAGIRNAFRAHVISDMEFERAGFTPDEMKLMEISGLSEETIARALGVPGWLVGLKSATSGLADKGGSARADMRVYWQNTILPDVTMRDAILTEKFCPRFGTGIRARTDFSQVVDLNEPLLINAQSVTALAGRPPFTVNEVRSLAGKPARPEPEADELYIKPDPVPFGGAPGGGPSSPTGSDPGAQAPVEEPVRARRMIDGDEQRETRRRAASANLARYRRRMQSQFAGMLDRQKARLIAALEAHANRSQQGLRGLNIDEMMMPDPEDMDAVQALFDEMVRDRGEEALADLALDFELIFNAQRTSGWVKTNAARVLTQVSDTTKAAVREVLATSLSLNESVSQLVGRIREMPEFDNARAALIARTESGGAYNYASREAWAQSGVVDQQEWLSARDSAVRDTHAEADGQVVGLGEPFMVGDSAMDYPGDPMGDPSETCNCRCTTLPVVNEAARKRKNFEVYLARVLKRSTRPSVLEGLAR